MNKQEWSQLHDRMSTDEYKTVHRLLNDWKQQNGITKRCVVHHRDDNDEVRSYNELHYERWGLNPDGTFEYGKYVLFMTQSEHLKYHFTGAKSCRYGKKHSLETRALMKQHHTRPMLGTHRSDETKMKIGLANKGYNKKKIAVGNAYTFLYNVYVENDGKLKWNDFKKALKAGEITFEMQPVSVFVK